MVLYLVQSFKMMSRKAGASALILSSHIATVAVPAIQWIFRSSIFLFPAVSRVINVIASRRSASAVPARDARTSTRASRRGAVVDGSRYFWNQPRLGGPELGSRRRITLNRPDSSLGRVAGGARRPFRFVVFLTVVCPVCAVRQVAGVFTTLDGPHRRTPRAVLTGAGGSRSGGVPDVATASHNYKCYVG